MDENPHKERRELGSHSSNVEKAQGHDHTARQDVGHSDGQREALKSRRVPQLQQAGARGVSLEVLLSPRPQPRESDENARRTS